MAERGLATSREKAQRLILAGRVLVDDQKVEKCGLLVDASAGVRFTGKFPRYVGRGGEKLEAALDYFHVDPRGKTCMDIGSSTGGFTDCLLQRGAGKVFAVDVGTNQLDWRLRQNPHVVVMEETDARALSPSRIGERIHLLTVDVSFISAALILPVLARFLYPAGKALILVKPQFEVGRGKVGKGGVVRDPTLQQEAVDKIVNKLAETGFRPRGVAESALKGASGNREFFVYATG